jgi:hypothetical protein
MGKKFLNLNLTPEEYHELMWSLGEHRRILRDQSSNIYSRHLLHVTQNLMDKFQDKKS